MGGALVDPVEQQMFARRLTPTEETGRCARTLYGCLCTLDETAPLPERLDMVERIAAWIGKGPRPPLVAGTAIGEPAPVVRLRLLLRALELEQTRGPRLGAIIRSVLAETRGLDLFCEAGLPNDRGIFEETGDRLARRLLPSPADHGNLAELVARCFSRKGDALWLKAVDPGLIAAFGTLVDGGVGGWAPVVDAMADAVSLLATRVSALGLSDDIRKRSPPGHVRDSPFFQLPQAEIEALPPLLAACRGSLEHVHDRLEQTGVSVDVVYRMDVIAQCLDRIEAMLPILLIDGGIDPGARTLAAGALAATLVAKRLEDRSLRDLVGDNLRLLARKIIERAGATGEHYITVTRREYWKMLGSGAGGGVLTGGTTCLKFLVKWGHYAPFVEGFLAGTNYFLSFLAMQLLGFTLATKQPSMTAAALAGTIRDAGRGQHRMDELVTTIARICRSQLAAAIGNVGFVIPAALLLDLWYGHSHGTPFLDEKNAEHVVASFHPIHTGTVFYAALTGVILWLSSLGAGWLENWAVYRRLPEAIADHRIKRWVGAANTARASRFFAKHIAGFGGNVTVGYLLGFTPVLGTFFGLPLDIRHVTLSTGQLALAARTLGPRAILTGPFLMAMLGIMLILAMNFIVSFVLALAVALRAREVGNAERLLLLGAVLQRFRRSPGEFLRPPRRSEESPPPSVSAH